MIKVKSLFKKVTEEIPQEITKDKTRDALRLGMQSAVAAAVTFIVMRYFDLPEVFLALLSAVLIVAPSIGDTFEQAKGRLLATLVGVGIGIVFLVFIPFGYGTAVSLLILVFIINAIASFKPSWRYGVVAAIAMALSSEKGVIQTSQDRLIAIGIGIAIGLLCATIIWPNSASKRANKHLRKALFDVSKRLAKAYQTAKNNKDHDPSKLANQFNANLGRARGAANAIKFGDRQKVMQQIDHTERLYNSVLIIARVARESNQDLLNKEGGIKNDSEAISDKACSIINTLANKEKVSPETIEAFEKLLDRAREDITTDTQDKNQTILRHAFLFGLNQIGESLKALVDSLEAKES